MYESTSQAEMPASQFGDAREREKLAMRVSNRLRGSTLFILKFIHTYMHDLPVLLISLFQITESLIFDDNGITGLY